MEIIINFLSDAAKIIFGSAVLGFFVPGIAGKVTLTLFFSGLIATMVFLGLAVVLSNRKKKI